jgi:hypothetical protein
MALEDGLPPAQVASDQNSDGKQSGGRDHGNGKKREQLHE